MKKNISIMIVDDSDLAVKKLSKIVTDLGYDTIHTCHNGDTACHAYEKYQPNIVTMDINMPGIGGLEAAKNILEKFPDAIIVIITSHGREQIIMDAIKIGVKGYILKPIQEDKVKEVFDRICAKYMLLPSKESSTLQ